MNHGNVTINDEEIVELAQYINSMEYDLLGYGFVTPKNRNIDIPLAEELEKNYTREEFEYDSDGIKQKGVKYLNYDGIFFDKDGVLYNSSTGKNLNESKNGSYTKYGIQYNNDGEITDLSGVNTSYLKTYALSDKRIYILRNKHEDLIKKIVKALTSFIPKENYNSWANGLVCLYNAKDSFATGEYVKSITKISTWGDAFEFKDNGKFIVKKGLTNNAMEYSTEGWIARYGLSQDFLISLHLATLSPELVQTIVQSYDTEIQVYLNEIKHGKAEAVLIDTASSEINTHEDGLRIADFKGRFDDIGLNVDDKSLTDLAIDIDAWYISKKEAKNFYRLTRMNSPINCTHGYDVLDGYIINDLNADGVDDDSYYKNINDISIPHPKDYVDYDGYGIIPTRVSYDVIKKVTTFMEELKQNNTYGFSEEDYNAVKSLLDDEDDCAAKNLYPEDDPYNPEIHYEEYEMGGFHIGYADPEKMKNYLIQNIDLPNNAYYSYDEDASCVKDEYGRDLFFVHDFSNTEEYYRFGSVCGLEYGIPGGLVNQQDQERWNVDIYKSHVTLCSCNFCQSFWNKYYVMQMGVRHYVNPFNAPNDNGYDETKIEEQIEECIDATGPEYKANGEGTKYDISEIYSWEYTNANGEVIEYNLSFFRNDSDIYLGVTRSWTEEEAADAKARYKNNEDTCASTGTKKVCKQCRKYVKNIVKTLKYINDEDYAVYVPYIARVIDSWFRDTYFIIPKNISNNILNQKEAAIEVAIEDHGYSKEDLVGGDILMVQNDLEFLEGTGELWTKYMMNPDGDYALFILNTTGELLKSTNDVNNYLDKLEISRGLTADDRKLLEDKFIDFNEYSEVYDNEKTSGFGRWKGEDKSVSEEDKEKAEELLEEYDISLVKIPISKKNSGLEGYSASTEIAWSAYTNSNPNGKVWQKIEVSSSSPKAMKKVMENYNTEKGELSLEVGLEDIYTITQEQDAQRGITNSKIKYLFKNKKYYKYDGTVERAYAIYNDWQECISGVSVKTALLNNPLTSLNLIGKSTIKQLLRPTIFSYWGNFDDCDDQINGLKETALNAHIDAFYYQADSGTISKIKNNLFSDGNNFKFARDFNGDDIAEIASLNCKVGDTVNFDNKTLKIAESTKLTEDPRNPDLISNIDLNTEGLAAFSILENTKTLDADYAYRDLKELFCELDYFDKEDLTEPPQEVLEWLLPNTKTTEWPVRLYDKTNEYGSLIHSAAMYKNLIDIDESVKTISNNSQSTQNTTTANTTDMFEGYEKAQPIVSPATAKILEIGTVEVTNENTKTILERFYVSSEENTTNNTTNNATNTSADAEEEQKIVITLEQKEELQKKVQDLENDSNNPFGNTYTTGYIKLEIIGAETMEKFEGLKDKSYITEETYNALQAFYTDYYNEIYDKSICDSYILYIEGIDLTSTLEVDSNLNNIDETIIGKIIADDSLEKIKLNIDGKDKEYKTNYYSKRVAPKYYVDSVKENIKLKEESKEKLASIIKNDKDIYVKAGTLLGLTGDANIKIIMKDKDDAVVENVEDYFESGNNKGITSDLARYFFVPYEGGTIPKGATTCINTSANDGIDGLAVGLFCWTTHVDGSCNNVPLLFTYMVKKEPGFCESYLSQFCNMTETEIRDNEDNIRRALESLSSINEDLLVQLQLDYKEYEVSELLEQPARQDSKWILERGSGLIGTYYSLINWIPFPEAYNGNSSSSKTWEDCLDENASDEENIISLMEYALEKGPSLSARWNSQCRLAIDMTNCDITEDDLMAWIRGDLTTELIENYDNGKNSGYIESR